MRTEGFNASLEQRGVSVKLLPSGPNFMALVEDFSGDFGQFALTPETRGKVRLSILNSALGKTAIQPGNTFHDVERGIHYTVGEVEARPHDIAARFVCEETKVLV